MRLERRATGIDIGGLREERFGASGMGVENESEGNESEGGE